MVAQPTFDRRDCAANDYQGLPPSAGQGGGFALSVAVDRSGAGSPPMPFTVMSMTVAPPSGRSPKKPDKTDGDLEPLSSPDVNPARPSEA